MHRFFISPDCFSQDEVLIRDQRLIHQLSKVLRLQPGDRVILLDGLGNESEVKLVNFSKVEVTAEILGKQKNQTESAQLITLYQALPKKPALFEEILQHGTEIGISHFIPLLTERTETQRVKNPERTKRILQEAAEQSKRGIIPELSEPVKLINLIQNPPAGVNLLADSYCEQPLLKDLLPDLRKEKTINFFIGPEGGFSKKEVEVAREAEIKNFSLSSQTLRTETAGVAITSTLFFS